jgi:cytochrome c5
MCLNCHANFANLVAPNNKKWQFHAANGWAPRNVMDQVEELQNGYIAGFKETSPGTWEPWARRALDTVCKTCHASGMALGPQVSCDNLRWKKHLAKGESNREVWGVVSEYKAGSTCGW